VGWFLGFVVYALIWWTALFCVLPIGVRPDTSVDLAAGGWRGTPSNLNLGRKLLGTTVLAAILWIGVYVLIESDLISFRDTWLAIPDR